MGCFKYLWRALFTSFFVNPTKYKLRILLPAAVTQPGLALSHAHQQLSPVPIAELVTQSRTLSEL